jgi:agmatinase
VFPGATAERGDADYAVVGAPLDRSASFRPGARFGPERLRQFARGFEDYDRDSGLRFSACGVHDAGDVRAWPDAPEYLEFLTGELTDLVDEGLVPLLLGGEHTVTVAGVRAVDPDVFVCCDAHLDLRERYDGDPYSHATVTRHALKVCERAVVLGARAGSEAEWERAGEADVTAVPPVDVPDWTPDFEGTAYLSVDVDAADAAYVPATGTPEPFGLAPRELCRVVRAVAPRAAGVDVVEVTDRDDGQTAVLGAKLLRAFVFAHAASDGG